MRDGVRVGRVVCLVSCLSVQCLWSEMWCSVDVKMLLALEGMKSYRNNLHRYAW